MDKIIQGNVANIVFLKSTDDEMIQTLEKQSGTTHRAYRDGKSVQRNLEKIAMKNQGTVSYQTSLKEEPVIRYNDMAYIDPRNSIIFRAGASPIWNRNEMILPMSWRLLQNTIKVPGKEYSLQTIPTTSSVLEFDVRKNQPNFVEILEKRIEQAMHAEEMEAQYKDSFGYSDYQVEQLDPDLYADEIMEMINQACGLMDFSTNEEPPEFDGEMFMYEPKVVKPSYADNELYYEAESKIKADEMQNEVRRYADNQLSRSDIVHSGSGEIHGRWDSEVIAAYLETRESFKDKMFVVRNGELYSSNGDPYIVRQHNSIKPLNEAAKDPSKRTYGDGELEDGDLTERSQWHVTDAFYRFLVSCDQWDFANGRFDFVFAQKLRQNT